MPLLTAGPSKFLGGGRSPWYRAGGAPVPVAVYQPKGAADLAASYVNLANPGTYNATTGVAPTFDAASGWIGSGSAWLRTGITSANNMSVFVRFAGMVGSTSMLIGSRLSGFDGLYFTSTPDLTSHYYNYGSRALVAGLMASGVMAIAGGNGYRDGALETSATGNSVTVGREIYMMALNTDGTASVFCALNVSIQAIAIYSSVLTADQVAAVSAAMAAL